MHVHSDGMAGAMGEILGVTGVADVLARHLVHFPPGNAPLAGKGLHDFFDAGVARAADDVENLNLLF